MGEKRAAVPTGTGGSLRRCDGRESQSIEKSTRKYNFVDFYVDNIVWIVLYYLYIPSFDVMGTVKATVGLTFLMPNDKTDCVS